MLGRARIAPLENGGHSYRNHLFTDAANQDQNDLMDEARFRAKEPLRMAPIRTENALANRNDRAEMSKDEAEPDRNVHKLSRFGPKGFPQKRPGSDRKASYR